MWYWNQRNFEALQDFSKRLAQESDLETLSEHYALREQGLRKQAFQVLQSFLTQTQAWSLERRREVAAFLVAVHLEQGDFHHLLSHPLVESFVLPTLRDWRKEQPSSASCLRSLGVLLNQPLELKEALELDPEDSAARLFLINLLLSQVEYGLHELPGGVLGDPVEILEILDEVDLLLACDCPPERVEYQQILVAESGEFRQALSQWLGEVAPPPRAHEAGD